VLETPLSMEPSAFRTHVIRKNSYAQCFGCGLLWQVREARGAARHRSRAGTFDCDETNLPQRVGRAQGVRTTQSRDDVAFGRIRPGAASTFAPKHSGELEIGSES
jgi:hypothetical protein